jgi:hypothetical protein
MKLMLEWYAFVYVLCQCVCVCVLEGVCLCVVCVCGSACVPAHAMGAGPAGAATVASSEMWFPWGFCQCLDCWKDQLYLTLNNGCLLQVSCIISITEQSILSYLSHALYQVHNLRCRGSQSTTICCLHLGITVRFVQPNKKWSGLPVQLVK